MLALQLDFKGWPSLTAPISKPYFMRVIGFKVYRLTGKR